MDSHTTEVTSETDLQESTGDSPHPPPPPLHTLEDELPKFKPDSPPLQLQTLVLDELAQAYPDSASLTRKTLDEPEKSSLPLAPEELDKSPSGSGDGAANGSSGTDEEYEEQQCMIDHYSLCDDHYFRRRCGGPLGPLGGNPYHHRLAMKHNLHEPLDKYSDSHLHQSRRPNPYACHEDTARSSSFSSHGDATTPLWLSPPLSVSPNWASEEPSNVAGGLANLGNTCFLNSILQCFMHTVVLVKGLRSFDHPLPCDCGVDGFCLICELRDQIEVSLTSTGSVVSPLKLVDNLSYFSCSFRRFQQEDAHEFLQCFLDKLDNCCNQLKAKDEALYLQDDNFVKQSLGGRLISKLRCCNCDHCSDTYEPSIDLSLEIEDVDTLLTALESFTKVEKLEDPETKFTCENCKEEVAVEKQLLLEQAPSVAAFHLKRFKNDGSNVEKIDKHVEFPLELDLLPYTSDAENRNAELKYQLYAVVVHKGGTSTSGHYYCFIRSAPDTWYKFDDSKVKRVSEDFVLSLEAYILFYSKQGTPWFSSFMETLKPSLDRHISNTSPKSVLDNVEHICTSPGVANNKSFDANETSNAVVGISTNGSRQDEIEGSDAKDDLHRVSSPMPLWVGNSSEGTSCKGEGISAEPSDGSQHSDIGGKTPKDDSSKMYSLLPLKVGNFSEGNSGKAKKKVSTSALEENKSNQKNSGVKTDSNVILQTPPRSPSPDIYKEEPPEVSFLISREHLKLADQVSCRKQLDLKDSKIKEAQRMCKNMGRRGEMLMSAVRGSHSEGSANMKRKRMDRDDGPASAERKANLRSSSRLLAAGGFR